VSQSTPHSDLTRVITSVGHALQAFDRKTILLTGGTGFIGTWVLESLAYGRDALGLDIRVIVQVRSHSRFQARLPHLNQQPWLTVVTGDVKDVLLPEGPIDYLIHTASTTSPVEAQLDPIGLQQTVVAGTTHILKAAALQGCTRALLMSSGSVYGTNSVYGARIPETGLSWPECFSASRTLAEAKRAAEAAAALIADTHALDVVIARGFAMSGPWLPIDGTFALGNFIADALAKRPITVTGNGAAVRSYLCGSDVTTWLLTLLVNGKAGTAYNVGGSVPYSILEVANLVATRAGCDVLVDSTKGGHHVDYFVPDVSRAGSLGLRETVSLDVAIDSMLTWHASPRAQLRSTPHT
jgi:nucleoside-diphosphate-sugar epimerase